VAFRLRAPRTDVRLVSRAAIPQELGLARDARCLGVALRQMVLFQGRHVQAVDAAHRALTDGFHAFEPEGQIRWTNGDAVLPASLFDSFSGPLEVVLYFGAMTRYIDDGRVIEWAA